MTTDAPNWLDTLPSHDAWGADLAQPYDDVPEFDPTDSPEIDTGAKLPADLAMNRTPSRRLFIDYRANPDAYRHLETLPGLGETLHGVISGKYALFELIPALIERTGQPVADLYVATLSFSKSNAADILSLLDDGHIRKMSLLISYYYKSTSREIYDMLVPQLRERGHRVLAMRTHAKILLAEMGDGSRYVVETSANLRSSVNIEQFCLTQDDALHDFHRRWMDELFKEGKELGDDPAPAPKRKAAYSQKRASLGVWAHTTAREDRDAAIVWKTGEADADTTARYAAAVVGIIKQWSPILPPGACITTPPQGASYPGRYAAGELGRAVARILDVPYADLLARTDEKHYHHPREAMRQKPYKVTTSPPAVVIVVDDLITSGTTMRLALEALRQAGSAAFGFAYAGC